MNQKDNIGLLTKELSIYKEVSIVRLRMVKESRALYGMKHFSSPEDAVLTVKPMFELCDREVVVVLSVDTKCTPLAAEIVAIGGLDTCIIDPRTIYKHALLNNAAGIFCFHNHPSGEPEPSDADEMITERLYKAGRLLGVRLFDHIIIGEDTFFSFQQHDMLGKSVID